MNESNSAAGMPGEAVAGGSEREPLPPAQTARPTLAEQIEEVGREVRQRECYYPEAVLKGRLKQATANKKLRDLAAAQLSLMTIQKHADGLRSLISILQRVAKYGPNDDTSLISDEEAAALLELPEVKTIVEAFPDASIETRALAKPTFDFLHQLEET